MPVTNSLQYLALGDSYTIGEAVTAEERFPFLTVQQLRNEGVLISDPHYVATTGWTTQNLLDAIAKTAPAKRFDIVTLLIGVNDQYQGLDASGYRERFTKLLARAIELAGNCIAHVFVLSIPDYSKTPFVVEGDKARVEKEVSAFNIINKEITEAAGVSYINITAFTTVAAFDASLLAEDGLHYSAKAHARWADLLVPEIQKALLPS